VQIDVRMVGYNRGKSTMNIINRRRKSCSNIETSLVYPLLPKNENSHDQSRKPPHCPGTTLCGALMRDKCLGRGSRSTMEREVFSLSCCHERDVIKPNRRQHQI
jgi:hypothetical protein